MGALSPELSDLTDGRLEALPRPAELGSLNFTKSTEELQTAVRYLRALDAEPPAEVSDNNVSLGNSLVDQLRAVVQQMEAYDLQSPSASAEHPGIVNTAHSLRNQVLDNIRPQIRATEQQERLTATEAETLLSELRTARAEGQTIVSDLQVSAGRAAAGTLSGFYSGEATDRQDAANKFLIAGALVAATLLGLALWLLLTVHVDTSATSSQEWVELVRNLVVRLAILGLVSYALTFCVRGYRSNQHLAIMNKQKKVALDTYPLFFDATSLASEARDVITAALVQTVFSPADTGLLDSSGDRTIIEGQGSQLLTALIARRPTP